MEIPTALDVRSRGANADTRSGVSIRRETAGSIRRAAMGYPRCDGRAPGCRMVENEAKKREEPGSSSPTPAIWVLSVMAL